MKCADNEHCIHNSADSKLRGNMVECFTTFTNIKLHFPKKQQQNKQKKKYFFMHLAAVKIH